MADNLERLILKQNERLQTENERLRAALEIAANDLDYCGACTDADNARAALGGEQ
jgi:hypothetical protein